MIEVKIGLLFVKDDEDLAPLCGYRTSASAITVAMERIRNENLLPNVNFTYVYQWYLKIGERDQPSTLFQWSLRIDCSFNWYYDECELHLSGGYASKLILDHNVDAIIGPSCSQAGLLVAKIAHFYNIPLFFWGNTIPVELAQTEKYPTTSSLMPQSSAMSKSLILLLKNYNWTEFAFLYSKSPNLKLAKCSYVRNEITTAVDQERDISITFRRSMDFNDPNLDIYKQLKLFARVVAVCMETDAERRNFLKYAKAAGLDTHEFVFVYLESRYEGFGLTPFWIDHSNNSDGLDQQLMTMCQLVLVLDGLQTNLKQFNFSVNVIEKMKEYPFYCTEECAGDNEVSTSAVFLADTMYLYAMSLNQTITKNGPSAVHNGKLIVENTKGTFTGYAGTTSVDGGGNLIPRYQLYAINEQGQPDTYVRISFFSEDEYWQPEYKHERVLWESRGGVRPLSRPICDFDGSECPEPLWVMYKSQTIVGASLIIVAILSILGMIIAFLRSQKQQNKRLDELWQINEKALIPEGDKMILSVLSFQTQASKMQKKIPSSDSCQLFKYNDEHVVGVKYHSRPQIGNKDKAVLRMMVNIDNDKLNKFFGLCIDAPQYIALWRYCKKGSLKELISNGTITLNSFIIISMIKEIAEISLIRDCWNEDPGSRPNINTIIKTVKTLSTGGSNELTNSPKEETLRNLIDHVYKTMEEHTANLELAVKERTMQLIEEKKKSDILLYRMLPRQVVDKLKLGETIEPETFENVTIFFCDVVKFTVLSSKSTPLQLIDLINIMYTTFDTIVDDHHVYKVETIGDAYFCVSGLPERNGDQHAKDIAEMAFGFISSTDTFIIPHLPNERILIRVGIHTGPCVAGVIGRSMPRYCLFGDTIDVASSLESNGKPGQIQISNTTNHYLCDIIGGYQTDYRGVVNVKGQGPIESFWLLPSGQDQHEKTQKNEVTKINRSSDSETPSIVKHKSLVSEECEETLSEPIEIK